MLPINQYQNPEHPLVKQYADKLNHLKQVITNILQQEHPDKSIANLNLTVWTQKQITDFEIKRQFHLPDELKVFLMEIGEARKEQRGWVNFSPSRRKSWDYEDMRKPAISADKVHEVRLQYGHVWLSERYFDKLQSEDKFRLYRKVPLFAPQATYELFRLPPDTWVWHGCLWIGATGNSKLYLILNGAFEGEIWEYDGYGDYFAPASRKRLHLLDFVTDSLGRNKVYQSSLNEHRIDVAELKVEDGKWLVVDLYYWLL